MKVSRLLFLLITCALALPAAAQSSSATSNPSPAQPAATPGQLRAATKLLDTIYSEESFNQLIEKMLDTQLKARPEAKAYENELRAFMRKYMSWSSLKGDMATIYAQEFTEAELLDITRFYESPAGRKAATKMPVLMQKGMELAQHRVQEHLPELQKAMTTKTEK